MAFPLYSGEKAEGKLSKRTELILVARGDDDIYWKSRFRWPYGLVLATHLGTTT